MREPPAAGYNEVHLAGEGDARCAPEQEANQILEQLWERSGLSRRVNRGARLPGGQAGSSLFWSGTAYQSLFVLW